MPAFQRQWRSPVGALNTMEEITGRLDQRPHGKDERHSESENKDRER
jgi:hypothetical protein